MTQSLWFVIEPCSRHISSIRFDPISLFCNPNPIRIRRLWFLQSDPIRHHRRTIRIRVGFGFSDWTARRYRLCLNKVLRLRSGKTLSAFYVAWIRLRWRPLVDDWGTNYTYLSPTKRGRKFAVSWRNFRDSSLRNVKYCTCHNVHVT